MATRTVAGVLANAIRNNLGKGPHSLDAIYRATSKTWPFSRKSRKAVIRATLQRNSSGSPAYTGNQNLFRHFSEGVWGLAGR
jgi:hypothetical protein